MAPNVEDYFLLGIGPLQTFGLYGDCIGHMLCNVVLWGLYTRHTLRGEPTARRNYHRPQSSKTVIAAISPILWL